MNARWLMVACLSAWLVAPLAAAGPLEQRVTLNLPSATLPEVLTALGEQVPDFEYLALPPSDEAVPVRVAGPLDDVMRTVAEAFGCETECLGGVWLVVAQPPADPAREWQAALSEEQAAIIAEIWDAKPDRPVDLDEPFPLDALYRPELATVFRYLQSEYLPTLQQEAEQPWPDAGYLAMDIADLPTHIVRLVRHLMATKAAIDIYDGPDPEPADLRLTLSPDKQYFAYSFTIARGSVTLPLSVLPVEAKKPYVNYRVSTAAIDWIVPSSRSSDVLTYNKSSLLARQHTLHLSTTLEGALTGIAERAEVAITISNDRLDPRRQVVCAFSQRPLWQLLAYMSIATGSDYEPQVDSSTYALAPWLKGSRQAIYRNTSLMGRIATWTLGRGHDVLANDVGLVIWSGITPEQRAAIRAGQDITVHELDFDMSWALRIVFHRLIMRVMMERARDFDELTSAPADWWLVWRPDLLAVVARLGYEGWRSYRDVLVWTRGRYGLDEFGDEVRLLLQVSGDVVASHSGHRPGSRTLSPPRLVHSGSEAVRPLAGPLRPEELVR